jgi:hypothetical protein
MQYPVEARHIRKDLHQTIITDDVAVGDSDYLCARWAPLVYLVAFRLPALSEDILSNSSHTVHVLCIPGFECVRDFISCHECLVSKNRRNKPPHPSAEFRSSYFRS